MNEVTINAIKTTPQTNGSLDVRICEFGNWFCVVPVIDQLAILQKK